MGCPFCEPDPAEQIRQADDYCYMMETNDQVLSGSLMILPKAHREGPFDLTEAEVSSTFRMLREAKSMLDSSLHPDGYSIGWNYGQVAGQTIPHAHLHVVPRFRDEPMAGKGIRWALKQDSNRRPGA